MKITFHDSFEKAYAKRIKNNPKLVAKSLERIKLFQIEPRNPILRDHSLSGVKTGFRAFSVTGNYRVVYKPISDTESILVDIGTHNQVY